MYFCSGVLHAFDGSQQHCRTQKRWHAAEDVPPCMRLKVAYFFLEAVGQTYGNDALVEVINQLVFAFKAYGELGVDVVFDAAAEVAAYACLAVNFVKVKHIVTYGKTYQGVDMEVFGEVYPVMDVGVEVKHRHFVVLEKVVEGGFAAEVVGEEVLGLDAEACRLGHLCVVKDVYADSVRSFLRICAYAEDGAEGCQ